MTSYTRLAFQKTDAYQVARRFAARVNRSGIRHAELRDQATRAAISVFLQISEGMPNKSQAMRRKYFTCARNSLCEVAAAIDLSAELGVIDAADAEAIAEDSGRLIGLLVGLSR